MIQINLLPGGKKKARGRSSGASSGGSAFSGFSFGGLGSLGSSLSGITARVKDPYLAGCVAAVVVSGLYVGTTYVAQTAREASLATRVDAAVADSAHYATVLRERATAMAQRDSVARQLQIIKAIDNDRFIWPHVLDEVSRALPPYTWLASIEQTSTPVIAAQLLQASPDSAKKGKGPAPAAPAAGDTVRPALRFRIIGNTVDIQALTRFMKDLEASPFVQGVTLNKSDLVLVDGKEVTQFQLDCEYQTPDPAAIRTVPVSSQVR